MATVNRQQYEQMKTEELIGDTRNLERPFTQERAQEYFDADYPKSTEQAIEELNERGFAATPWRIERYCKFPDLAPPMVAGVRVWSKEAIDAMAAIMEENGNLTDSARWRRDRGLTWQDEQALLAQHKEAKEVATNANVE